MQIERLVTDVFFLAKLESFQPKATRNILFVTNKSEWWVYLIITLVFFPFLYLLVSDLNILELKLS